MLRIITDSAAEFTQEEAQTLGIEVIPLTIVFGKQAYLDGKEMEKETFYERMSAGEYPHTSQPSTELFREAFERAAGEEAIVILISSKISGTLNAARIAKEEGGFDNVLLYDSLCTTAMQRILVEEAVRRRDRSAREVAEILDGLRPRLRLFAALDTLEYLYKGGRIKGGTALMGKLLGIKPVVELTVEGEVKNVGRAHGRKKALAEVKRLSEREKRDPAFSPYYLYCKTEAACDELTELTGERSARRFNICCAVGAHIGPNAAGVVYVVAQE